LCASPPCGRMYAYAFIHLDYTIMQPSQAYTHTPRAIHEASSMRIARTARITPNTRSLARLSDASVESVARTRLGCVWVKYAGGTCIKFESDGVYVGKSKQALAPLLSACSHIANTISGSLHTVHRDCCEVVTLDQSMSRVIRKTKLIGRIDLISAEYAERGYWTYDASARLLRRFTAATGAVTAEVCTEPPVAHIAVDANNLLWVAYSDSPIVHTLAHDGRHVLSTVFPEKVRAVVVHSSGAVVTVGKRIVFMAEGVPDVVSILDGTSGGVGYVSAAHMNYFAVGRTNTEIDLYTITSVK